MSLKQVMLEARLSESKKVVAMKTRLPAVSLRIFLFVLFHIANAFAQVPVQSPTSSTAPDIVAPSKSTKTWKLLMTQEPERLFTLTATEAPLIEITDEISHHVKAPIQLSAIMQKQLVSADLKEVSIETLLKALAPVVFLDEAVILPLETDSQLLGVYLSGVNEALPALMQHAANKTETVLFMGNISDETSMPAPTDQLLEVKAINGRLSVKAKKQPATLILYEMAQQFSVSFEIQQNTEKVLDIDLQGYRFEDAIRQLDVPVKLIRRRDVALNETQALRVVLLSDKSI